MQTDSRLCAAGQERQAALLRGNHGTAQVRPGKRRMREAEAGLEILTTGLDAPPRPHGVKAARRAPATGQASQGLPASRAPEPHAVAQPTCSGRKLPN